MIQHELKQVIRQAGGSETLPYEYAVIGYLLIETSFNLTIPMASGV